MFFSKTKIRSLSMNEAILEMQQDKKIILIDVRTPEEYVAGHIAGSKNIPLQEATQIQNSGINPSARIFVYCLSGMRSRNACGVFEKLGYDDVTNIGGINDWTGELERG